MYKQKTTRVKNIDVLKKKRTTKKTDQYLIIKHKKGSILRSIYSRKTHERKQNF
jgi:hypothetical protein